MRSIEYAVSPIHFIIGRDDTDTASLFITDLRNGTLNRDLNTYRGFDPATSVVAEGLARGHRDISAVSARRTLAAGRKASRRRGLGSGWFREGLHGNALIAHLEDLERLRTARRSKDHLIAFSGLHQRAG